MQRDLTAWAAEAIGITASVVALAAETDDAALRAAIEALNADDRVDGILMQLPLPPHLSQRTVAEAMDPRKDVDGISLRSAGDSGHKRRKGSKVHLAVDTLGQLLALTVTPANQDERTQVEALAQQVQEVTGEHVELAWVDQGYTGDETAETAQAQGIRLEVIKLPEAKRGFVLLPRRWVVERTFAWIARARRLARDDERLPEVLAGLHFVLFAGLLCPCGSGYGCVLLVTHRALLRWLPSDASIPEKGALVVTARAELLCGFT